MGNLVHIVFDVTLMMAVAWATVKISDDMSSIAFAQKEGQCQAGKEGVLFQYVGGPGVVTEQWFTGYDCFDQSSVVTYYIDDNPALTISANLYMMLGDGIGTLKNVTKHQASMPFKEGLSGPYWATRRIGHIADGGGMYSTIRIPFSKSITVTLLANGTGALWFILRGMENYPVVVGDLELPRTARLKLYKHENIILQPLEFITLAYAANQSGLLYLVSLIGQSDSYNYLEACFRAIIDGKPVQYLSSGTEDFFLSAYYYNTGLYQTYHAGLMRKDLPGTMSAYKFFEDDPILFKQSLGLVWRCGEARDNHCFFGSSVKEVCEFHGKSVKCFPVLSDGTLASREGLHAVSNDGDDLLPTKMSAYIWIYVW